MLLSETKNIKMIFESIQRVRGHGSCGLVSICNQIIIRPGEEIVDTDGAGHVLNGACNLHRSISIHKKPALKT